MQWRSLTGRRTGFCVVRSPNGPRACQGLVKTKDWNCSERMTTCHRHHLPIFIGRRRGGFVRGCTCPLCTFAKDRRPCPEMKSLHQPTCCQLIGAETLTYFHPRVTPHLTQYISRTVWLPVVIWRSHGLPSTTFTLQAHIV